MECFWILLGVAAVAVIFDVVSFFRTRRIAASRPGENFDTFRAAFADDIPEDVLRATYAELQKPYRFAVADYPLRPDDPLATIHSTVEELVEAAQEVVALCGRQWPPTDSPDEVAPFRTVRDFVQFVAACPPAEGRT